MPAPNPSPCPYPSSYVSEWICNGSRSDLNITVSVSVRISSYTVELSSNAKLYSPCMELLIRQAQPHKRELRPNTNSKARRFRPPDAAWLGKIPEEPRPTRRRDQGACDRQPVAAHDRGYREEAEADISVLTTAVGKDGERPREFALRLAMRTSQAVAAASKRPWIALTGSGSPQQGARSAQGRDQDRACCSAGARSAQAGSHSCTS